MQANRYGKSVAPQINATIDEGISYARSALAIAGRVKGVEKFETQLRGLRLGLQDLKADWKVPSERKQRAKRVFASA